MRTWKGYGHGINLGGWLSQCNHTKERYDNFIREEDIARISGWGLDHIRLPIDYNLVETAGGEYIPEGFGYIEKTIGWCRKYGLKLLLDLHKTYGFSFDAAYGESGFFEDGKLQERFYRLWEELARRFGQHEDMLAFELLNEVTDKAYSDKWNGISGTCIDRIRQIAPTIWIAVGGYHNNSIAALPDLAMPKDEKIVYNFHCYEPLIFTHQGAYWVEGMDRGFRTTADATYGELAKQSAEQIPNWGDPFPGFDPAEKLGTEFFERSFAQAVRVAEERNVPLYCGEYGVINLAKPEDTVKWYRMISAAFNRFGIGRAAWSYKEMNFGFVDEHMKDVLPEVLKCL